MKCEQLLLTRVSSSPVSVACILMNAVTAARLLIVAASCLEEKLKACHVTYNPYNMFHVSSAII